MQVRVQTFAGPTAATLSVATSEIAGVEMIVAAGFLPADELLQRYGLERTDCELGGVADQIVQWQAGRRASADLPIWQDGSTFQRQVWNAIGDIPSGETATYGEIAASIGRPGAARAVGTACGQNRVAPFIPCHRVVPASGGVGSYGYGSALKSALLALEELPSPASAD